MSDDYMDREVRSTAGLKYTNRRRAHIQAEKQMDKDVMAPMQSASKPVRAKQPSTKRGSKQ